MDRWVWLALLCVCAVAVWVSLRKRRQRVPTSGPLPILASYAAACRAQESKRSEYERLFTDPFAEAFADGAGSALFDVGHFAAARVAIVC